MAINLCIASFTFGKNLLFLFIKAISLEFSCYIFVCFGCLDNAGLINELEVFFFSEEFV